MYSSGENDGERRGGGVNTATDVHRPSERELYNHFKLIAEAVPDTPALIYNNPGRVGYGLKADFITKLAHEIPNIVGLKDTSGDITLTEECVRRNRDIDFKVFGGKDMVR